MCTAKSFAVIVAVVAVLLAVFKEHNIRGPRLWLDPVPTADLTHDGVVGRTVIVTGANTGIGKEMAVALSAMGAHVIMACRSIQRGNEAAVEVRERARALSSSVSAGRAPGAVDVMLLNLGSFKSIRAFVSAFNSRHLPLHVLLNNAAVFSDNTAVTEDGLGEVMGVNHFGVLLLTHLLLPNVIEAKGRVVVVASEAHNFAKGRVNLQNPDLKGEEGGLFVYGTSKLANIIMTRQLAKRLVGSGVTVNCLHPGLIKTELHRNDHNLFGFFVTIAHNTIAMSPWQGAQNSIHLATAPQFSSVSGNYYEQFRKVDPQLPPREDEDEFWRLSLKLTGITPWNSYTELVSK